MSGRRGRSSPLGRLRRAGGRVLLGGMLDAASSLYAEAEWWSLETLRERQWEWLRATLDDASRSSAFYRERLRGIVGPPLTRAQFARIPALRRTDLVTRAADIAVRQSRGLHRTSGGSGGAPAVIPFDRRAYGWYIAGTWRGFGWWGVEPSDPVCLLLGRSSGSRLHSALSRSKDWLLNWRRVPVDDGFDERVAKAADAVVRFSPAVLYGYPSAIHQLARAAGSRMRGLRVRVVVLTGEPVYAFQRDQIADAFECPVAEEYGSGELGSVAFECPRGGLHVSAEAVLLETVPCAALGAGGMVLATHLRNRRFPLIRYETGDIGEMGAEPCPCGRGLPTVRVLGRERDRLIGEEPWAFARPRVERLMGLLPRHLAGSVQVAQSAPDALVVRVSRAQARPADVARTAAAGREAFGPAWRVQASEVDRIARIPSGKMPYFVGLAG